MTLVVSNKSLTQRGVKKSIAYKSVRQVLFSPFALSIHTDDILSREGKEKKKERKEEKNHALLPPAINFTKELPDFC